MAKKLYIFKAKHKIDVVKRLDEMEEEKEYYSGRNALTETINALIGFKSFIVCMDVGQEENDILQTKLTIPGKDKPDSYLVAVMDDPREDALNAYRAAIKLKFDESSINPHRPDSGTAFGDVFTFNKK